MIGKVLKIIAAGCFLLAVFDVHVRIALIPLGLLFWVVSDLV